MFAFKYIMRIFFIEGNFDNNNKNVRGNFVFLKFCWTNISILGSKTSYVSLALEHVYLKTLNELHKRFCFTQVQGPMIHYEVCQPLKMTDTCKATKNVWLSSTPPSFFYILFSNVLFLNYIIM